MTFYCLCFLGADADPRDDGSGEGGNCQQGGWKNRNRDVPRLVGKHLSLLSPSHTWQQLSKQQDFQMEATES